MKKLTHVLAAALLACSFNALAHGEAKPMYGGTVKEVLEVQYELVPQAGGAALYVLDHGKPMDATRMGGKLTVLNGAQKSEAELKPAGGNKLEAAGLKLGPGAKVVAAVKGAEGKVVTVRFSLR